MNENYPKPIVTYTDGLYDEKKGIINYVMREFIESDFKYLFSDKVINRYSIHELKKLCLYFNIKPVVEYTQNKINTKLECRNCKATEDYPIYIIENSNYKIIYEPVNPDFNFRYRAEKNNPNHEL